VHTQEIYPPPLHHLQLCLAHFHVFNTNTLRQTLAAQLFKYTMKNTVVSFLKVFYS